MHRTSNPPFPLLERAPAAIVLTFVSGLLNAWTFTNTQTFATVQSGNMISIGYFLVSGDLPKAFIAATSVVSFLLGAFICSLLVIWLAARGRAYSAPVLWAEAALLVALTAVAGLDHGGAWWVAWAISFLAGVQSNAFHRETGMLYGNVAVTSVVQMAGSLLGRAAGHRIATDGQPHLRPAGSYLLILVAFSAGGGIGFGLNTWQSAASLVLAAGLLATVAVVAMADRGAVDPSQNAPTP